MCDTYVISAMLLAVFLCFSSLLRFCEKLLIIKVATGKNNATEASERDASGIISDVKVAIM